VINNNRCKSAIIADSIKKWKRAFVLLRARSEAFH